MAMKLRAICEEYRGLFVQAMAFKVEQLGSSYHKPPPGQKWGYIVAVGKTPGFDDEMVYGPASDYEDYFTREAAEQAALHFGKLAVDVYLELG